eukprot:gene8914-9832_t
MLGSLRLLRPHSLRLSVPSTSSNNVVVGSLSTRRSFSTETFWKWTTQPRPFWMKDWKEGIIACIVFGITGTASMMVVRPTVEKVFNLKGSLIEGPNSYRIVSLLCISPIYAVMLTMVGTLAGRHSFFAGMAMKIARRFIPCSFSRRLMCQPARNKLFPASK